MTKSPLRRQKEGKISVLLVVIIAVIVIAIVAVVLLSGVINLNQNNQVRIRVSYTGSWTGAYGDSGSLNTWGGAGSRTVVIDRPSGVDTWTVVANAMKTDFSGGVITVTIETMSGTILKQGTSSTAFGLAQCSVSLD